MQKRCHCPTSLPCRNPGKMFRKGKSHSRPVVALTQGTLAMCRHCARPMAQRDRTFHCRCVTAASRYGTSLKLAQGANRSTSIKGGEHYSDGNHFTSTQDLGALSGGKLPSMPSSALNSQRGTPASSARSSRRSSHRGSVGNTQSVRGDVLGDTDCRSERSYRCCVGWHE